MKIGYVLAFAVVAGYLAFETYAVSRSKHRMEDDFIYRSLVEARVGAERCGDAPAEEVARVQVVVDRVRGRLREDLAEAREAPDSAAVEAEIDALTRTVEAETWATLDAEGCESNTARRLVRRHLNWSRR